MPRSTKKVRSKKPLQPSRSVHPSADDYQMVLLWSDEDECYVVTLPAWQNTRTHGATLEEATRNGLQVLSLLIETALKNGEAIPAPERRYSGNLRLRLPVSMHARLAQDAEREGVSLNQWIVSKLAS
jgi:antitoxin HicB